ncbi:hypothetical protein [Methylosinus sporium]|uniref:hypothetical protein n=1 Tax=Methylosinus sporium TaxID=428 RepID=UPI00383A23BE
MVIPDLAEFVRASSRLGATIGSIKKEEKGAWRKTCQGALKSHLGTPIEGVTPEMIHGAFRRMSEQLADPNERPILHALGVALLEFGKAPDTRPCNLIVQLRKGVPELEQALEAHGLIRHTDGRRVRGIGFSLWSGTAVLSVVRAIVGDAGWVTQTQGGVSSGAGEGKGDVPTHHCEAANVHEQETQPSAASSAAEVAPEPVRDEPKANVDHAGDEAAPDRPPIDAAAARGASSFPSKRGRSAPQRGHSAPAQKAEGELKPEEQKAEPIREDDRAECVMEGATQDVEASTEESDASNLDISASDAPDGSSAGRGDDDLPSCLRGDWVAHREPEPCKSET